MLLNETDLAADNFLTSLPAPKRAEPGDIPCAQRHSGQCPGAAQVEFAHRSPRPVRLCGAHATLQFWALAPGNRAHELAEMRAI